MTINVLKNTSTEAVVQVIGSSGTIALTSLLSYGQSIIGQLSVNITGVYYSTPDNVSLFRNSVEVLNYSKSGSADIYNNVNNTSDIVCNVSTGSFIILRLRKVSGFSDIGDYVSDISIISLLDEMGFSILDESGQQIQEG